MSIKKRGGIWFVRVGAHRFQYTKKQEAAAPQLTGTGELTCTLACGAFALYGLALAFARLAVL